MKKEVIQPRVLKQTSDYINKVAKIKGLAKGQAIDLIVSQCKIKVN